MNTPIIIEDNSSTMVASGDVLFIIGLLMFLLIVTGCLLIHASLN